MNDATSNAPGRAFQAAHSNVMASLQHRSIAFGLFGESGLKEPRKSNALKSGTQKADSNSEAPHGENASEPARHGPDKLVPVDARPMAAAFSLEMRNPSGAISRAGGGSRGTET